jgi:hypothetical protein
MGFVQVDTINTVERAHHLILAARLKGYRPELLSRAIEHERVLFEHWTHDASVIPTRWYPHWQYRFDRYRSSTWHRTQMGPDPERVMTDVLERVRSQGPLTSSDFEHEGEKSGSMSWWKWKPQKAALDYLWRTGALYVSGRRNFQKVYDLPERVIPIPASTPRPTEPEHVDWACRTALERLGLATAREIAQFWNAVKLPQVRAWLNAALATGEVSAISVGSADGSSTSPCYALPGVMRRIRQLPDPTEEMRLLSPFDPVVRDRARAKRLFGFDFRFEGFVPAAKRKHGYYVMPILQGDRFVGKADPKFDRSSGTLQIKKVWWEPGVRQTKSRAKGFHRAVEELAQWIGATNVAVARGDAE